MNGNGNEAVTEMFLFSVGSSPDFYFESFMVFLPDWKKVDIFVEWSISFFFPLSVDK